MNRLREAIIDHPAATVGVAATLGTGLAWGYGKGVDLNYGSDEAKRYVEQSGYKDVHLQDIDVLFVAIRGCSQEDSVKYEFVANAPNGENVGVAVCKGLLKSATIRQQNR